MKDVIIIGANEFAEMLFHYIKEDYPEYIKAFTVEKDFKMNTHLFDIPIVTFSQYMTRAYSPNNYEMITAITYKHLNRLRTRLYLEAKEFGYDFISYISKDSTIDKHTGWGENCVILNNNNLQYKVQIGNNVVLWSGNHIGHSTEIYDNCFISSGVTIAGNCKIGRSCFIGIGANIIDGISVGEDCIIAAGACITEDTEPKTVYAGVPAKAIRRITEKDLTNGFKEEK